MAPVIRLYGRLDVAARQRFERLWFVSKIDDSPLLMSDGEEQRGIVVGKTENVDPVIDDHKPTTRSYEFRRTSSARSANSAV